MQSVNDAAVSIIGLDLTTQRSAGSYKHIERKERRSEREKNKRLSLELSKDKLEGIYTTACAYTKPKLKLSNHNSHLNNLSNHLSCLRGNMPRLIVTFC
jgi:hypothetical protein